MTPGKLPWDIIQGEVRKAVYLYMIYNNKDSHWHKDRIKHYIKIQRLVDYIVSHPHPTLFEHLIGVSWDITETRCELAIRKMGWVKFSRGVYAVPLDLEGNIAGAEVGSP